MDQEEKDQAFTDAAESLMEAIAGFHDAGLSDAEIRVELDARLGRSE